MMLIPAGPISRSLVALISAADAPYNADSLRVPDAVAYSDHEADRECLVKHRDFLSAPNRPYWAGNGGGGNFTAM